MTETFEKLGLNEKIIKAITELGYEKPTAVQSRIIPTILTERKDIVCLAQTGTGKTAAFGLPTLHRIEERNSGNYEQDHQEDTENNKKWYSFAEKGTQALILSPTRELCRQIAQDLKNYAKYMDELTVVAVYGGAGMEQQIKALRKNPQVIVATPGRMLDLLRRHAADISNIHTLILDEADEMLNMGFKEDLDGILESTPKDKRVLLFSATLPIEVERIAKNYMKNAELVTVGERNSGSDNVKHYYFTVHEKERYSALKRITDYYPDIYGIIFCRTRKETQDVANALIKDGYDADALHGDLSQGQRDQVMGRFRNKSLHLLVATDVAARGIDVNNLTHVINYNLPDETEQYTHRSGRTGRADKSGKSIVIINSKELHKIRRIEKMIGKTFARAKIPTGEEVCSKQLLSLIDKIDHIPVSEAINEYLPLVAERWESLSREEIIQKFIACEFNRFIEYYKNAPDLNILEREVSGKEYDNSRRSGRERGDRRENGRGERGERSERGERGKRNSQNDKYDKEKKYGTRERGEAGKNRGGKENRVHLPNEWEDNGSYDKRENKNEIISGDDVAPKKVDKGFLWVKMNIGAKNNVTTRHIIRMMTTLGVGKKGIGKIDIRRGACYVSIADRAAKYVVEQTNNSDYRGVKIKSNIFK